MEETVTVTVESDRFYINDYRYRLLASAVTETGEPDLENGDLYVLDAETGTVVDLETMLSDDEGVSLDSAIVLMPGQTLDDLDIDELDKNDILIRFSEFTPVFTPLSSSEFTFLDPEDYSGTVVEELPTLFTELIHDGRQVVPVEEAMDGNVNLSVLSLSAVSDLTILAAEGIQGLDFGRAFSADNIHIQSTEDLHVGSKLLGGDMVEIHPTGDLFFDDGAAVEADLVDLQASNLTSAENSLITAAAVHVVSGGNVLLYADAADYSVDLWDAGDVWISDVGTTGTKSFSHVMTPAGDVTILAESTVLAGDMAARQHRHLRRRRRRHRAGRHPPDVQQHRHSRRRPGDRSRRRCHPLRHCGGHPRLPPGSTSRFLRRTWGGEAVVDANQSLLIGPGYYGSLNLEVPRDIIIDTEIVAYEPVNFSAANIIFTENGAIRYAEGAIRGRSSTITLNASEQLVFPGETARTALGISTIQGSDISIEAGAIVGSDRTLVSGDSLAIVSGEGFALRTAVRSLQADIAGPGDLKIDSLTSVELTDVSVFDGDLEVVSPGNIVAKSATIETDRFSNKVSLLAAGTLSLDALNVGQMVELEIEADAGTNQTGESLIVTPISVDDTVYRGEEANFQVEVRDPSRAFDPVDGMVDLLIDFGDGSEPEAVSVPYIEPEIEQWGEPSLTIEGDPNFGRFGNSITSGDFDGDEVSDLWLGADNERVAVAGDVNGDGIDDLLTSLPDQVLRTVSKRRQPGRHRQYGTVPGPRGPSSYSWVVRTDSPSRSGRRTDSTRPATTARGFPPPGIVNGDGFDDVLVGSPYDNSGLGIVQLFLGGEGGLSSEPVWTYEGESWMGGFGTGLAPVGDVDGDGFDDVMITAPFEDAAAGEDSGKVYLFRGSAVFGLHEAPEAVLEGDEAHLMLGSDIAALGDMNGDGFNDVAVSASGYTGPEGGSGAVYVFFGWEDGIGTAPRLIPPKVRLPGIRPGDCCRRGRKR